MEARKGLRSLGAGVKGGCVPSNVDVGKRKIGRKEGRRRNETTKETTHQRMKQLTEWERKFQHQCLLALIIDETIQRIQSITSRNK